MLLIGDIHITARYKDKILKEINDYVDKNNDEKNIIFLGDFVYHFSYHRTSLLDLFSYFLTLISQGKNVFVLSGNHDWLGQHFVFSEAQNLLKILKLNNLNKGKLYFITQPEFHNIEGKEILFFPFNLNREEFPINNSELDINDLSIFNSIEQEIYHSSQQLLKSENKNEQISGQLNFLLLNLIKKYQKKTFLEEITKKLTIIHHHYIANTIFPGQRTRFVYKNIALNPLFTDIDDIQMIAGHLHQGFVYKNFICSGSVRHTSPTEYNHYKLFFKRSDDIVASFVHINPYLIIENNVENPFGKAELEDYLKEILLNTKKRFSDWDQKGNNSWKVIFDNDIIPDFGDCSLTFKTKKTYKEIDNIILPYLQKNIKDVKLKIPTGNIQELTEKLNLNSKNLGESINDRKNLLKSHILNKYQDRSESYFQVMNDLKLL